MSEKLSTLSDFRPLSYYSRIEKIGEYDDTCLICGKRTKNELSIQMSTDGKLHLTEEVVEDSQGWFPIGPDCLSKVKKHLTSKEK